MKKKCELLNHCGTCDDIFMSSLGEILPQFEINNIDINPSRYGQMLHGYPALQPCITEDHQPTDRQQTIFCANIQFARKHSESVL